MSASVGSTDHPSMRVWCPTRRFFYSLFSVLNPPQPGIPANIRWTRLLLAAMCAALILPTFFFFLRFMRTAAATAAGMRSGRIPPRCFRRRFRRGPQCMSRICSMEDAPWVFYSVSHDGTIKGFPRIFFPLAGGHFPSTFFTNGDGTLGLMIPDGFGDPIPGFENP